MQSQRKLHPKIGSFLKRAQIALSLRFNRFLLNLNSLVSGSSKQNISFDFIWNLQNSNLLNPKTRREYLRYHLLWDEAGTMWEAGQYQNAVNRRRQILGEVYNRAGTNVDGYSPPIMEEWWTTRIGHLAVLGMFSFAQELGIVPKTKRYLLMSDEVGNVEIRNTIANRFISVKSIGKPAWSQLSQFWPICEKMQLVRTHDDFIDQYALWEKVFQNLENSQQLISKTQFSLPEEYVHSSEQEIHRNYQDFNDKFVVMHIRGSRYWEDRRSQDVKKYLSSIRYLISKGYFVIRVGDTEMTPLEEGPGFLDLTRTKNSSAHLHAFLLSHCRFMIGTTSGPSWIPALFGKPVLMTNATSIGKIMLTTSPGSIYLPKGIVSAGRKKSLPEILLSRHAYSEVSQKELSNEDLFLEENSEEEILLATEEMVMNDEKRPFLRSPLWDSQVRDVQDATSSVGKGKFAQSFLDKNFEWFIGS